MIAGLKEDYPDFLVGYSDHTLPCKEMLTLITSYTLGAVIIEKHFTHNKKIPGNDHYHAMDVEDLKKFVSLSKKVNNIKGFKFKKDFLASEKISRLNARRSIVAVKNLSKGDYLNEANIICKRPGTGITPLEWDNLIGKKLIRDVKNDQLLSWDDIESI
tara:strand:- start:113 stop:589 length:477 start_codon:yes stop_codon:yes gene_type:complete